MCLHLFVAGKQPPAAAADEKTILPDLRRQLRA